MEAHISFTESDGVTVHNDVLDVTDMNARIKYVSYSGQTSKDMRQVVTCQLFDKATQTAISPIVTYSGTTYAYQVANTAGMTEAQQNLANAMICYVDAAIAHFG